MDASAEIMGASASPLVEHDRRPASSSAPVCGPRVLEIWETAQVTLQRSRQLIADCRVSLVHHRAAVTALRSTVSPAADPVGPGAATRRPDGVIQLAEEVPVGPLTLHPLQRVIRGGAGRVQLTSAEWQLLAVLAMNPAVTLSRSRLAATAWGAGFSGRHGEVEVYVSRLRRKLARAGGDVTIQTVRGQGYRLVLGEDDDAAPQPLLEGGAA